MELAVRIFVEKQLDREKEAGGFAVIPAKLDDLLLWASLIKLFGQVKEDRPNFRMFGLTDPLLRIYSDPETGSIFNSRMDVAKGIPKDLVEELYMWRISDPTLIVEEGLVRWRCRTDTLSSLVTTSPIHISQIAQLLLLHFPSPEQLIAKENENG